ncbi:ABC transporter substrate-binding protein [Flavobacterium branchiophilum NBRC 15030 = ATCC 35035]|uniref:Ca3427-like PBP 2 domain-containing protein n=1 Tax=Flavobacterium branchiophilum TaxID=55197 RepID=A0A543G7T2_9FLAO|nr:substrate-binding domain-containing protein [Flavobacterium branchiophilum]OXA72638.1 ABC transporter substrate-binding protein [Flavobacterium branchiophilum NBRC 15030 = ATCC 35035]TQM42149.1 hypothetical protein BC670_3183 [Flavobacterium branchiophilum]GEM53921.1 ABC transporter substrate-binding protein [Flavobacterium branchiophilum NBRC 15030 = ATCC 35035]
MKKVKIAGVPEHFNFPWQKSISEGQFEQHQIDLEWTSVPEGTGKLCEMLRHNETDIAIILTEGIIKDIVAGNCSKIVQIYVDSPLLWGIHVSASSKFQTISDLYQTRAAISRKGSGSELMTYVHAKEQHWPIDTLQFEIVHTMDGAVKALIEEKADYFMWEHYMTKPLVDNGIFRRLGDCPTPWPSFVIAVTDNFLDKNTEIINIILNIINNVSSKFKLIPNIDQIIAEKFSLQQTDVAEWLKITNWSDKQIAPEMLNSIQNQLVALHIINKKGTFAEIIKAI